MKINIWVINNKIIQSKSYIIIEFNDILRHEKIMTKNESKFCLSNEILNFISKRNDILLIINAEYDAPACECTINYYNMYWGIKI